MCDRDGPAHADKENRIEAAVESMRARGAFSAGDIKKVVGNDAYVSPVLRRMIDDGLLLSTGKKRGTKYVHALPPIVERAGWMG